MRVYLLRVAACICLCVFLMGYAQVSFADDLTYTEAYFSQKEGYSGVIQVPGKGAMRYYAQNDPLWSDMAYEQGETQSRRPFGDGGCGPTAGAMAIANLVPEGELGKIALYAKKEYAICPCSITKEKCIHTYHARYVLTSQRDFTRFLPLVLGDFAIGNNTFGVSGRGADKGTNSGFLYQVAQVYGLNVMATTDKNTAFQALKNGCTVVGHAARGGAFTNTGHYVLIAHTDDEKVYVLDPLARDFYKTNQSKILEIIQPGLVAIKHSDYAATGIGSYMIFSR
ncbi:MAG: hypothetical protein IK099_04305 [Clostridia bacterium]|nr:hypothetical protein [Clostridia bacterium]